MSTQAITIDPEAIEAELGRLDLAEGLRWVAERYLHGAAFSTSLSEEDQVIGDVIWRNHLPIRVFTLDTGRLFEETYALIDETRAQYGADIETYFPEARQVERLVGAKGFLSFYESVENRKECCQIRKVLPLRRALRNTRVWVTGLRAEQSPNRQSMRIVEWDAGYGLLKYNPLIRWTAEQVARHVRDNHVPVNPLHQRGFVSIGCAPCTRAIAPGEDPRAGRWWWETSKKECGLHR